MDNNLFVDMIHIALIGSIIATQICDRIKHILKLGSRFNKIMANIISFVVGFMYSYCFYSRNYVTNIWIGIFTLIGAEGMYQSFKGSFGLKSANNE